MPPSTPPGLNSKLVSVLMRWMSRFNVWIYQLTGGRIGGKWRVGSGFPRGVPVALLTTTGRKSGLQRTTPLLYLVDADRVVMVASQGGRRRNPGWYWNILSQPDVHVQIGPTEHAMKATVAGAEERAELWPKLVSLYADFATYQTWTEREIPVVIFRTCTSAER